MGGRLHLSFRINKMRLLLGGMGGGRLDQLCLLLLECANEGRFLSNSDSDPFNLLMSWGRRLKEMKKVKNSGFI